MKLLKTHRKDAVQQRFWLLLPSSGLPCNGCGSAPSERAGLGKSFNKDQPDPTLLPTHLLHIPVPQIGRSNEDRGLQLQADLENTEVNLQQPSGAYLTVATEEDSLVEASLHPAPISHLDFSKKQTVWQEECLLVLAKAGFSENKKKTETKASTFPDRQQPPSTANSQNHPIEEHLSHFTSPCQLHKPCLTLELNQLFFFPKSLQPFSLAPTELHTLQPLLAHWSSREQLSSWWRDPNWWSSLLKKFPTPKEIPSAL